MRRDIEYSLSLFLYIYRANKIRFISFIFISCKVFPTMPYVGTIAQKEQNITCLILARSPRLPLSLPGPGAGPGQASRPAVRSLAGAGARPPGQRSGAWPGPCWPAVKSNKKLDPPPGSFSWRGEPSTWCAGQ